MNYRVIVLENKDISEFEGEVIIKIDDLSFRVAYQAPIQFAKEHIRVNEVLYIDLWLIYGKADKTDSTIKELPTNLQIAGGNVKGKVIQIFSPREFRVDCGLLTLDIHNDEPIKEICKNDYIETVGTFAIYFPNTDWARN